jgi:hypothetical protein
VSLFSIDWNVTKVGLIRSTTDDLDLSDDDCIVRRVDLDGVPFELSYLFADELFLVTIELAEEFFDYDDDEEEDLLAAWNALFAALQAEFGEPAKSVERRPDSYTRDDYEYWARKSSTRVRWAAFERGGSVAVCELSGGSGGLISLRAELMPASEFEA